MRKVLLGRRALLATTSMALMLLLAASVQAGLNPGDLDPSFGGDGKVTTDFAGAFDDANDALSGGSGKTLLVGEVGGVDFGLVRYRANGTLDPTFGGDGRVTTDFFGGDDGAWQARMLPTGRILVVGWAENAAGTDWHFAIARYKPNGQLDGTFGGGDGKVTTRVPHQGFAYDLAVFADGSFVVVGEDYYNDPDPALDVDDFAIARYKPNGRLNRDFANDGIRIVDFADGLDGGFNVGLHSGNILVGGWGQDGPEPNDYDVALAQLRPGGGFDGSFGGGDGRVLIDLASDQDDYVEGLRTLRNKKFLVAPFHGNDFALARFRSAGNLDPDFGGGDGLVVEDFGGGETTVDLVRHDGNLYVVGTADGDMAVAAFRAGGALIAGFGSGGLAVADFAPDSAGGRGGAIVGGDLAVGGFAGNDFAAAMFVLD